MNILGFNIPFPSFKLPQKAVAKKPVSENSTELGALPVAGGRSSQAESAGLFSGINGLTMVPRIVPREFIEAIEHLTIFNPDFSHATDNVCDLAATKHHIKFDASVSDAVAKMARLHIESVRKSWYLFGDGHKGLITDLLRQCCNAGCVSAEIVPSINLKGVQKVVLVAPSHIEFLFSNDKDEYMPYQRPNSVIDVSAITSSLGFLPLNTVTYKYFAMYRTNDHPYAIPPFLSAIENTNIGKELMSNIKWVAKNMGVLGIISLLTTPPAPAPGETMDSPSYQTKCLDWLTKWRAEAEQGLKNGIIVGFKGNHEVNVAPSHVSAQGAKDIWQLNDTLVVSGLKQDGVLLNRDQKTSEAFAKVMYEILKSRVGSFQNIVAAFLAELYRIELQLAGFPIKNVNVEFDTVAISDKLAKAQAEKVEIENVEKKYLMGIITQEMAAQELGYEMAAEDAPLQPVKPSDTEGGGKKATKDADENKKKKAEKKKNSLKASLVDLMKRYQNGTVAAFDYSSEDVANTARLVQINFEEETPEFDDPKMQSLYEEYVLRVNRQFKKTVNDAMTAMEESLVTLTVVLSSEELINKVIFHIFAEFQKSFGSRTQKVINQMIEKGYRRFRRDKTVFGAHPIVGKVDLALPDFRAMAYFKASDELYLGRFITDPDTRQRITQFIKDTYLRDGEAISHNPDAIARFRKELGTTILAEDWKITRVISTTVNKMRNYAAVNYMAAAEVKEFEIRGVKDSKQCAYCAGMQGKRFFVTEVAEKVQTIVDRNPEFVASDSPFITSVFKDPSVIADMSSADLFGKGIFIPPLHPFCRDIIIAVLD